ncbi:replication initiator [Tsukamurella tyrosinosolvens]|uniref:replication initiator n=1 Tax=Tsukamurella tyrosinosolvens TaxID=57704 RepID=UPI00125F93B1|nr:replication initiator [Tsukamurella tyrosinosolvens]
MNPREPLSHTGNARAFVGLTPAPDRVDLPPEVIGEMVRRAAGSDYRPWWRAVTGTGFCSNPIHLHRRHGLIGEDRLMLRCGNRRAAVCPPCSRLYGGDTWQLVHAGILGGHHGIPTTVAEHPMAFVTLTAPSYGRVHTAGPNTGQPIDPARYDYAGHVLFTWWAPELWRRYTIRVRRLLTRLLRDRGHDPKQVRLTFLKVTENQARLIPHLHAVLRLDNAEPVEVDDGRASGSSVIVPPVGTDVTSADLAALALQAAAETGMLVPDPTTSTGTRRMSFGVQVDARPVDPSLPVGVRKRIAGYLAKYVTKSVTDQGLTARRISPQVAYDQQVLAALSVHARSIITTLTALADAAPQHYSTMVRWLHTLGYRGHVTTKSRRYSLTMGDLRAARALWRQQHPTQEDDPDPAASGDQADAATTTDTAEWTYVRSGHDTRGDHHLTTAAAKAHNEQLWARRDAIADARATAIT